ncbi:MAG: site-specific DNA-methyltransferase, partial [Gemmataceae bacterium]|nr:site-specific DNA-methyltransferase [Gemmataceae bacterium]
MPRKKKTNTAASDNVSDYRHQAKRKNNPPAKLAAEGTVPALPKIEYRYSPRLPPVLRFDPTGQADKLPELLEEAKRRKLTEDEVRLLAEALRHHEPWLEWAGKQEQHQRGYFTVDPVALHIHERVSAQAILKVAARQDVPRTLFADPEQEYHEAVQFYRHDVDWTNRMILGDSLQVMASLARREDLAGKVQMIYIDPPYGIKFASNFQPEIGRRDVKDKESDLTREPEMVKAYRDTWHLGIHSYLSYLRDRLIVARELLADTGSIFVQIGDENVHLVQHLMHEIFKAKNFIARLVVQKTGSLSGDFIQRNCDFLLWYGKDKSRARNKFRAIFCKRDDKAEGESTADPLTSSGPSGTSTVEFMYMGRLFHPGENSHWKTTPTGLDRLARADRITAQRDQIRYRKLFEDFPVKYLGSVWDDTAGAREMVYVVQTSEKITERCLLMTTDPGDLVLDPTCGSGTTAYVAEQWGRRWITI